MATSAMERAQSAVAGLAPGYFALVMASGIISVGMKLKGFELISTALLIVCIVGFVILLCLTVWRIVAYRGAIIDVNRTGLVGVSIVWKRGWTHAEGHDPGEADHASLWP